MNKMNWKDYEIYIHKHFKRQFPDATITHNVSCVGIISKTKRQIDILVEGKIAGFELSVIIECKYFNRKVNVKHVESFLSFLNDLKASKGILITNEGFSKAAFNRATYDTQDIELRIIDFKDLDKFQGFWAIAYAGKHCVFVSSPPGWVIDANPPGYTPAAIYPAGLTYDEAIHQDGLIYLNFIEKGMKLPDLKAGTKSQDDNIRRTYPNAKIEYFDQEIHKGHKCLLRIADIDLKYEGLEYTYFIDYDKFVLFFVLLEPQEKCSIYLPKLKWVAQKHTIGKILLGPDSLPVSVESI